MSEKQTADAVNNYVLNDNTLDELQYFKHKQPINIRATCSFNTWEKTFIAEAWRQRILSRNT